MGLTFISNKNRYEIRFHKDNNIEQSAHSFDTQAKALAHFRNIQITDRDFYSVAHSNGCDDLVYPDIITEFAKECIYMMEEEEVYPYDKRYIDVSYYVLMTQNGDSFIADMDIFWEMWNSDWEKGIYEHR